MKLVIFNCSNNRYVTQTISSRSLPPNKDKQYSCMCYYFPIRRQLMLLWISTKTWFRNDNIFCLNTQTFRQHFFPYQFSVNTNIQSSVYFYASRWHYCLVYIALNHVELDNYKSEGFSWPQWSIKTYEIYKGMKESRLKFLWARNNRCNYNYNSPVGYNNLCIIKWANKKNKPLQRSEKVEADRISRAWRQKPYYEKLLLFHAHIKGILLVACSKVPFTQAC